MRLLSLLVLCLLLSFSVACVPEPITPVYVIQYPPTYTPAPTGTNTPHPPTATLVIQRTPGAPRPAATRDPNARRVPTVPFGSTGVWLDVSSLNPESLVLLAPRAQVLVETEPSTRAGASGSYYLLKVAPGAPLPELGARYDGILVENADVPALAALRQEIAPRLLVAGTNLRDAADAAPILENADGICFCNFLRDPALPRGTYKSEADWKRDVDALAALTADPDALVFTATRFSEDVVKNSDELQAWLEYALSSFLLGANNSHSFFGFQAGAAQEFLGAPIVAAQLGAPSGAMYKANGVYQRRFAQGLVLVNPTRDAHAFALPRNYSDLNGTRVTQVTMPPASGMVLFAVK